MLKFISIFVSGILCSTLVSAQQQNSAKSFFTMQPCDTAEKMFKTIKKYDEEPLFTGLGIQFDTKQEGVPIRSDTVFFVNQDTGTWSLLSVYPDGMVCMVASGKDFEPYTGK